MSWVALGETRFDITYRALVMGILNRTTDSFFDQGRYWDFDSFLRLAEQLVNDGADFLDVGGVKAGPGPEVTEAEELDRVVPAIEALRARFDLPLSVDTWRASVAAAAYAAGASVGNDISGFGDPNYLTEAARAEASVVATHIRLRPRVADPEPVYPRGVRVEVLEFLLERAGRAATAGIPHERIVLDAGLDLGKTWQQSAVLLRASSDLAETGFPVLLSASNKTFLGKLLDKEVHERRLPSMSATALGIAGGCRLIRAHDVAGTRRVADVMAHVLEARADRGLPIWSVVEQSANRHSVVEQSTNRHSVVERSADKHSVVERSADKHSVVEQSADKHSVVEQSADKHSVVEQSAGKHSAGATRGDGGV